MDSENIKRQKVIYMNGFTHDQIHQIMEAVKPMFAKREVIFAMATENNLNMKVSELIEDLMGDHHYLTQNPPSIDKTTSNNSTD